MFTHACLHAFGRLTLFAAVAHSLAGCGGGDTRPATGRRAERRTQFESAPPVGQLDISAGTPSWGGGAVPGEAPRRVDGSSSAASSIGRTAAQVTPARPEGTDVFRVDGERLYVLNAYRGLMVFDITNVDDPKLLGRSPADGAPVEMLVRNGIATMVVGDFYGRTPDGAPFHGTVVRTIDARDPAAMKVEGEVQVKGSARDMRVVGDKLFIVSEDFGDQPRFAHGGPQVHASKVIVSSVSFGDRAPKLNATREVDGASGAFQVTSSAILVAHDVLADGRRQGPVIDYRGGDMPGMAWRTGKSALDYIAISPIDGSITPLGSLQIDGVLEGRSAESATWNIDFQDDTASIFTCASGPYGSCSGKEGHALTTVDFSNPSAPRQLGRIDITPKGWSPIARFARKRMYLAPREGTWSTEGEETPVEIYDLTNRAAPVLAGSAKVSGTVWRFAPLDDDRLFVLGSEFGEHSAARRVALRLLDVSNPAQPAVLAKSTFGDGWPWTPAAETFKTVERDDGRKLLVLPFSDWSSSSRQYLSGVQLTEWDTGALTTRGSARAKGWVERGVFVKDRLVALSGQSLSVIDYADRDHPRVVRELTLARDVVSAQQDGATIAQLSTDWWGSDEPVSELRVLPVANAEEDVHEPNAPTVSIDGTDAQVFRNGDLAYVVTKLQPKRGSRASLPTLRVQVVDLSNGGATLKGALELPQDPDGLTSPRWGGHSYWDWYDTSNIVQVGGSALAFRRTRGGYAESTGRREQDQNVYVLDLSDPDRPHLSSAVVTPNAESWWGNLKVVGDTLYATHYEHTAKPIANPDPSGAASRDKVRYYLDRIDLTDRASPTVAQRINVPGVLVGASDTDPSLLYFVDYRWDDGYALAQKNELAIARIVGDEAVLESTTPLDGWVGHVFVRGAKAYTSAQMYPRPSEGRAGTSSVKLLEIDLADPAHPVARATAPKEGWGWLVGVEGDRAVLTSGWGDVGLDIYALRPGEPPTYVQFARTDRWQPNGLARHGGDLYLATGYRGVRRIPLQ